MSGLIAIVGRPNVGKSAIFNRIAGRRIAIVHDEPGVTRDRVTAEVEWNGQPFTLVDTGGIGLFRGEHADNEISRAAMEQADLAIAAAHAILLVVNVQEGVVPLDREVAARLRKSGKPVLLVVNKVDHDRLEGDALIFAELGFDKIFPVSAIHGRGTSAVLDVATSFLPAPPVQDEGEAAASDDSDEPAGVPEEGPLRIAIVGRPNVGKSSLINALTRSERVIVSAVPGTTRDAIDVPFEVETEGRRERYILIDTAGVRHQRRVDNSIEFFSVKRTEDSIARCNLAIFVVDAEAGVTAQDKKVAGKILEERKACVVVVNKWDLVNDSMNEPRASPKTKPGGKVQTLADFAGWVQKQLFFIDYAPVIFTSAKSGFHLERLLEAIRYVAAQLQQTIPTALLNRTLHDAIERRQPVSASGHRLKFFYAAQVRKAPPTFLLFVNRDDLFSDAYTKHLSNELRRAFGFEGCPILLVPKPRPKTIEPIRKTVFRKPKPGDHKSTGRRPHKSRRRGHGEGRRKKGPG